MTLGFLYYPKTNPYSSEMKISFKYLFVTKSLSSFCVYIFALSCDISLLELIIIRGLYYVVFTRIDGGSHVEQVSGKDERKPGI